MWDGDADLRDHPGGDANRFATMRGAVRAAAFRVHCHKTDNRLMVSEFSKHTASARKGKAVEHLIAACDAAWLLT